MNFKIAAISLISLLLAACAQQAVKVQSTTNVQRDWPALQYSSQSSRLRIVDEEGNSVRAFDGNYFSVPGYIFVTNEISLHPGTHRISYQCPQPEGAIRISHYVPSVNFTFLIGKQYELHCVGGQPVISLAKEQEETEE